MTYKYDDYNFDQLEIVDHEYGQNRIRCIIYRRPDGRYCYALFLRDSYGIADFWLEDDEYFPEVFNTIEELKEAFDTYFKNR